ncbi:putative pentatricopeptide repeat-containing protein At3g15200 [Silene latifolia]|uniref:putative pentatricopeptide repeat-containing protein At3g15200 n=1 Tax=Silene latifolia TaxID=37657 RepID=UPI003D77ED38
MNHQFRPSMKLLRGAISYFHYRCSSQYFRTFHCRSDPNFNSLPSNKREQPMPVNEHVLRVHNLLRKFTSSSNGERVEALDNCEISLTEDLVLDVLRRNHSDWNSAFQFFNWVSSVDSLSGYSPSSEAYNEILGILGKARQFEKLERLFDEMFEKGIINERSFDIVLHRYAAAHKTDDAIDFFYKRSQYGLELDIAAFQSLLLSLCRYKHVEEAEDLFHSKKAEFQYDIKTWNIILNGWCVLRNLHETKRFWNELTRSDCKPDKYSYGIYINALCKSGKVSSALKLFRSMWENNCTPDVVICNSVIDGLCFKKRVPEALVIFREMNAKGCPPNVGTYNCLIKYMCKIQRLETASKLFTEMEENGGECAPNDVTYIHLLTAAKNPEEVASLLQRVKRRGFKMTGDMYNLLLRLYLSWDCEEHVRSTWDDMSMNGTGLDQRSYAIMIHKRYEQGRIEEALKYFKEMTMKKLTPEPKTILLVDDMKTKLESNSSSAMFDC